MPEQLTGPVRDFASALRHMHGELGLSLSDLESRLPASRSSLSRYLRGQSLPDERLLVQWCKLSFTGEDRLPELVRLLHLANEAAGTGEFAAGGGTRGAPGHVNSAFGDGTSAGEAMAGDTDGDTDAGSDGGPGGGSGRGSGGGHAPRGGVRGGLRAVLAVLAVLAVAGGATALALRLGDDGSASGSGTSDGAEGARTERVTVHNVDKTCTAPRTRECRMGLAEDPYQPYRPANIGGHVWHGDRLTADCRIANGVTVTDETGGHSSIWYRVDQDGKDLWLPGIRIEHGRLQYSTLRNCPDTEAG